MSFDDAGRLWSITATDYPVDANETPARAMALWKNGGNDRVVVFDDPLQPGPHTPRTFADGLAMPMGLLPWKNGAIVGHGPEILFLDDTNRDGKADSRTVLVKGFGVQDSHLLPHQFTMMPGGWIAMAQGAFNRSQVVAGANPPVSFDYCKMGRFRPDGSRFETIGYGLNNIWGLVLNRQGEVFIQEANDMNYSVVPFQVGSSYPGIGNQKFRPYAPFAPPLADFRLGGTGLSGLALSEDPSGSFPAPWHDVMFVANPITRTINAVRVHDLPSGGYRLERLPDFLTCRDEWFRPIAMAFGPDGCLYIVDWYNKIISHNEVPRSHPDRDKTRGRLWRVRHRSQTRRSVTNIAALPDEDLVAHLRADSTWEMRAAWRQIVFRKATALAPALEALTKDETQRIETRVHALWALRDLGLADVTLCSKLAGVANREIRREAAAIHANSAHANDPDPQVRAQAIRTLGRKGGPDTISALIAFAKPELEAKNNGAVPWNGRHGVPLPPGVAYDRAFERYLVRVALERHPEEVAAFLDSADAQKLPAENRIFAALALPPELSIPRFVRAWSGVERAPSDEELLLLLRGSASPELAPIVRALFSNSDQAPGLMNAALRLQDRLESKHVASVLTPALQHLAKSPAHADLVVRMSSAFLLRDLHPALIKIVSSPTHSQPLRAAAIDALARLGFGAEAVIQRIASSPDSELAVRIAALAAAGASADPKAVAQVLQAAKTLTPASREDLLDRLAGSKHGVDAILQGLEGQSIQTDDLDLATLERMHTLRPDDPRMRRLWKTIADRFPRALRLKGKASQYCETGIDLEGAFTVETWVRLAPGLGNSDGILGKPGGADFNFYDGKFRVYGGKAAGDLVVATRAMTPGAWTHLAVTRSATGDFHLFLDGELNAKGDKRYPRPFQGLNIGQTTPSNQGTAGEFMEFRIWNHARTADQIRSNFDRKYTIQDGRPPELVHYYPFGGDPQTLRGGAEIVAIAEAPPLLDEEKAAQEAGKLARFRTIVTTTKADPSRGKDLFTNLCLTCHTVGGKGAAAAPPLDGSGHRDLDSLLRAILTPDAAVEPGYRVYRVETHDGRLAEGFLVKHDKNGATLRFMGGAELQFPQSEIRRARYLTRSFMLSGLIDQLPEQDVADLIAYIGTLREEP